MEPITIVTTVLVVAFVVALVVGTIVRAARAPKGRKLRSALSPWMSAGETYAELHTGQRGVQDTMLESIQEQEHRGGGRDATGER
jgi:hypothetical protein